MHVDMGDIEVMWVYNSLDFRRNSGCSETVFLLHHCQPVLLGPDQISSRQLMQYILILLWPTPHFTHSHRIQTRSTKTCNHPI